MGDVMLIGEVLMEVFRQMDPVACLQRAHDAIDAADFDEARDALASYRDWRRRGGFEPDGGDQRAGELEQMLMDRGSRNLRRKN